MKQEYILLLLLLLTAGLYSNTLHSPFVFDDITAIQQNLNLRLEHISPGSLLQAAFSGPCPSRPVANLSFALDYYFNNSHNLVSLHLTNITIHLINTLLLYFFILLTLKTPALEKKYQVERRWLPIMVALLWGLHPLHTQSVTYIVQRMNSLATLFYILAFICYIKARLAQNKQTAALFAVATPMAGALALGSKEIAITLPAFLLLYEFFFFQDMDRAWIRKKLPLLCALTAGAIAIFFYYFGLTFWETIPASYARRDFTLTERLLTEPRVIIFYLSLIFFPLPSRLNLEHDFPLSHSLVDPPSTLAAITFLLLLFGSGIFMARKERLLAFSIFWFLGNLALESSFIPLEIIFEHRTYLPSMGVCLAAGLVLIRLVSFRLLVPLTLMAALLLATATFARNRVWESELSILMDCVKKSPNKARPLVDLGNILLIKNKPAPAIILFERAIRRAPSYTEAKNSLGVAYARTGRYEEAVRQFAAALRIDPSFGAAADNMRQALKTKPSRQHKNKKNMSTRTKEK